MNAPAALPGALKKRRIGSLRSRAGLALGGAMLVLVVIFAILITHLLVGYFGGLQNQIVTTQVRRLASILEQAAKAKIRLARNSAEWDDTWNYLQGTDPQYLEKNYAPAVNSSGQDLVMVFSSDRKLAGVLQSRPGDMLREIPPGLDVEALASSKILGPEAACGVLRDQAGVLLLASCPVRPTDLSKPGSGWLIFGTYLDADRLGDIEDMSGMKLSVSQGDYAMSDPANVNLSFRKELFGGIQVAFPSAMSHGVSTKELKIQLKFTSLIKSSPVFITASTPVSIYRDAVWTRNWIIGLVVLGGFTLMAVSLVAGEIVVMRPLAEIDRQLELLSQDEIQGGFLSPRRNDEIGRLALSANRFLQRARDRQRDAEEQKELMDSILDSANEGIEAFQAVRNKAGEIEDFRLVLMNRKAGRIVHQADNEFVGRKMCETFPKLRTSGIFARYLRVATTREAEDFEIHYEGHRFTAWLRFSVAPWGDGVVVTFDDIGDRKNRERELSDSFDEIERFNLAMIGREERVIEMKREVNDLRGKLGLPPTYRETRDET